MRLDGLDTRKKRYPGLRASVVFVALAATAVFALILVRTGETPIVGLEVGLPAIGPKTPLRVTARSEVRGLTEVVVRVRQGDAVRLLHTEKFQPRPPWSFWGPSTENMEVELELDKAQLPDTSG